MAGLLSLQSFDSTLLAPPVTVNWLPGEIGWHPWLAKCRCPYWCPRWPILDPVVGLLLKHCWWTSVPYLLFSSALFASSLMRYVHYPGLIRKGIREFQWSVCRFPQYVGSVCQSSHRLISILYSVASGPTGPVTATWLAVRARLLGLSGWLWVASRCHPCTLRLHWQDTPSWGCPWRRMRPLATEWPVPDLFLENFDRWLSNPRL